jgi:hypothetical protein
MAAKPKDLEEWIDIIILGMDSAWRAGYSPEQIAAALIRKQAKNERQEWLDPKTIQAGMPIEHVRQ